MMILECMTLAGRPKGADGTLSVCNGGTNRIYNLKTELGKVEQSIQDIADRTKNMADELGAKYVVFRCRKVRYDAKEHQNDDIIQLSRETDDCIETIYLLEQRRSELLRQIREVNG